MNITAASQLTAPKGKILILLEMAEISHESEDAGNLLILAMADSPQDSSTNILRIVFNVDPSSELDGERYKLNGLFDLDLAAFTDLEAMNDFITVTTQNRLIGSAISIDQVGEDIKAAFYEWDSSKGQFEHEVPDNFHVLDLAKETAKLIVGRVRKYFELHQSQ